MTITTAVAINQFCRGLASNQRPASAEISAQGTTTNPRIPMSNPPKLAVVAEDTFPRTNQAQAVVIPHDGQGRFSSRAIVHSRNPNWRCVPNPAGSGRRHRAVTKSPNKDKPTTRRMTLSFPEIPEPEGTTTVAELTDCRTAGTLIVGIGIGKVDF